MEEGHGRPWHGAGGPVERGGGSAAVGAEAGAEGTAQGRAGRGRRAVERVAEARTNEKLAAGSREYDVQALGAVNRVGGSRRPSAERTRWAPVALCLLAGLRGRGSVLLGRNHALGDRQANQDAQPEFQFQVLL